ncbi:MAG: YdcF family protein [Clostridiales bacterium]|nr:YdcF family protein [Clostridiales bacterium]
MTIIQSGLLLKPESETKHMMKTAYKALCLFIAAIILFAGCGSKAESEQDIIEEMVVDYASYGSEADVHIDRLLIDLKKLDNDSAAKWSSIMDLWEQPEETINYDVLPDGLNDTDELCIIALGFQLNPDGSMRDELTERLKVVAASAEKYPNAYIVCTGGGTAAENKDATESGRMAEWLIDNGVRADRVIIEDKSLTTAQNAVYTFDILAEKYPQIKELVIISSDYHIATGTLLFQAESILRGSNIKVVSNAAWKAPSGSLSAMFQAGALIELSGDKETAFEIYYDNYDIHELPPI